MKNWSSLETRFRELSKRLPSLRLDIQTGAAGEYFNLTGDNRNSSYRQVLSLSQICGRLLKRSLGKDTKVLAEPDDLIRWYRFMKEFAAYEPEMPAMMKNADGTNAGSIMFGRIHGFCEECANVCLDLEAKHAVRDDRGIFEKLYADYGKELIIGVTLAVITALIGVFFG